MTTPIPPWAAEKARELLLPMFGESLGTVKGDDGFVATIALALVEARAMGLEEAANAIEALTREVERLKLDCFVAASDRDVLKARLAALEGGRPVMTDHVKALHHEPRRFPDGTADWKREYDDLTDRLTGLRRDYTATRAALRRLVEPNLKTWLLLRSARYWAAADQIKADLDAAGITVGATATGGATWAIEGTMVFGEVGAP